MLRVNWPSFDLWTNDLKISKDHKWNHMWTKFYIVKQMVLKLLNCTSDDNYLLLSKVDKILNLDPLTSKSIGSSNYFDVSVHQFLILVNCLSNKGFLRYWSNSTYSQLTDQLSNQRTDAIQYASFFTKRGEKQYI